MKMLSLIAVASMIVLPFAAQAQIASQNSKRPVPMVGASGPQPVPSQNSKRPVPLFSGPRGAQPAVNQSSKRPTRP